MLYEVITRPAGRALGRRLDLPAAVMAFHVALRPVPGHGNGAIPAQEFMAAGAAAKIVAEAATVQEDDRLPTRPVGLADFV